MKKILLAGFNSKYNHISLSTRALESYVKEYSAECGKSFVLLRKDFTINQNILDVLRIITEEKPDCLLISVYIWNVEFIKKILPEVKKLLPECIIGLGGPEVSYAAEKILQENLSADFIISGEGEETVKEFCERFSDKTSDGIEIEHNYTDTKSSKINFLKIIKGIYYRSDNYSVKFTGTRNLIHDIDTLPFVYSDSNGNLISDVDTQNSIIYYESSRGCPFKCSYCLSSIDKTVRFKSLEKVKKELDFFLNNKVRLVKFVDRTYNLNEERYIEIWKYIIANWNNKTTFHFEIEAQQLTDEALDVLQTVKPNCMQFEIGIQTTNEETLKEINRNCSLEKINHVLSRIPHSIHVHLDLIAGLPYETIEQFENSFNETIALRPRMLQLGFLKILHGTQMESFANSSEGYKWLSSAPYEVLCSPWMTYENIQLLKHIDYLVDSIYNSQNFIKSTEYIFSLKINNFVLFNDIEHYLEKNKLFEVQHKADAFFDFMYNFFSEFEKAESAEYKTQFTKENIIVLKELLRFDYVRRGKTSSFPSWYKRFYSKENHRNALENYCNITSTRDAYINSAYEEFIINPFTYEIKKEENAKVLFLFTKDNFRGAGNRTSIAEENTVSILLSKEDILPQKEANR